MPTLNKWKFPADVFDFSFLLNEDELEEIFTRSCEEASGAKTTERPWGTFTVLNEFKGEFGYVKIKKITVNPSEVLSRQYHNHRSEHWICLSGVAKYIKGEQRGTFRAGESVFIPAGVQHRLENIGIIPLEILEVQLGESVAEEDIIRLEDKYGRS